MKQAIGLLAITLAIIILISGCLGGEDGLVSIKIGENITDEWCIAGLAWDYADADTAIDWEIMGEESFKNATYCKIIAASETEILNATYYVSQNRDDMWYVMDLPDGTTQETHVVSPAE